MEQAPSKEEILKVSPLNQVDRTKRPVEGQSQEGIKGKGGYRRREINETDQQLIDVAGKASSQHRT